MERCAELIEKLKKDFELNATAEQLMITVCLLQKELSGKLQPTHPKKQGKVAIVLPSMFHFNEISQNDENVHQSLEVPNLATVNSLVDQKKYDFPMEMEERENDVVQEKTLAEKQDAPNEETILFDELPTTLQNQKQVLHLTDNEDTQHELNQHLQIKDKPELVELLTDAPIKDLKKGITLNDRFIFISELFRGDENMYERSVKTINNFQIYPEAQFWIERELRTKIGWDVENETVQHFYDLVKRRFA